MVKAGDLVAISFTARVHKVGVGNRVWVLVHDVWFAPDEYELLEES
ncbi:hypothetical protein J2X63_003220 [Agromyces sp. 3263]|nr:hypothetical protein [Agromyces sp. 3263]